MTTMLPAPHPADTEGLVEQGGRTWYSIPHVDRLAPFLMSVVSDGDRWMFMSSSGALTAGRRDANRALFPYETDDRLHRAGRRSGGVTTVRLDGEVWRAFDPNASHPRDRHLLKAIEGDAVELEESDPSGRLRLAVRWASCDEFGFVRTAELRNESDAAIEFELIDGLVDVLPFGLDPATTQRLSNLSNAYRRSEVVDRASGLAVYTIESPVSDQAEPEEVLRATTVWSTGLDDAELQLDGTALRAFELGERPTTDPDGPLTGRPGAYLLRRRAVLAAGESMRWHVVADVARDHTSLVALRATIADGAIATSVDRALERATSELRTIIARGDGLQLSGDPVESAHHFANVTYNVMRGGIPLDAYRHETADVVAFIRGRNRRVAERHGEWMEQLPPTLERSDLLARMAERNDPHLLRLGSEYLPFSFSRRHGDPSRPWNTFEIRVRDDAGRPIIHYEGNWRDVFQNWEALCASYPAYLPGVVSVFLNASTIDGFNPYRITRDGLDWEVPDPHDPWANIGYWGDHQLIYLLRLLDAAERHEPGVLHRMAAQPMHTYAAVPYRIAPYESLVVDPKATIDFDGAGHDRALERVGEIGADGRLVLDGDGEPVLVSMLEKLLVAALSKLSNFVPGGGIWMNTQRPEWNDANNALVGYGVSMVTLYHLRSFLDRLRSTAAGLEGTVRVSAEVAGWCDAVRAHLAELPVVSGVDDPDAHRRRTMDALGRLFSDYRMEWYDRGWSGELVETSGEQVMALCDAALVHLDDTIRGARRDGGLYESYSLLDFETDGTAVGLGQLSEMLEGQVAAVGCGLLTPGEQADVIDALFASALYRPDQQSFLLYPERNLPSFLDKNTIPQAAIDANPLLAALAEQGSSPVVRVDADGVAHFHPDLVDAPRLAQVLDRLAGDPEWSGLVGEHRHATLETFEDVFGHRRFTGRSGSMYAYEGIGSIYWHMVTKLLLAVSEAIASAERSGADEATIERLVDQYWRIRAGLGASKTAEEFGAVPTDPYSHTPAHAGAQQPGMTGAVKEELLARWSEVGLRVEQGEIRVEPRLLRSSELLQQTTEWAVDTVDGPTVLTLDAGSLGVTFCGVPFVLSRSGGTPVIEIVWRDGRIEQIDGTALGREVSAEVFGHTGAVSVVRATA